MLWVNSLWKSYIWWTLQKSGARHWWSAQNPVWKIWGFYFVEVFAFQNTDPSALFIEIISLTTIWSGTLLLTVLTATYKKPLVWMLFFFSFSWSNSLKPLESHYCNKIKLRTPYASCFHLIFPGFSTAAGLLTSFKIISFFFLPIFVYVHDISLSTTSNSLCCRSHRSWFCS